MSIFSCFIAVNISSSSNFFFKTFSLFESVLTKFKFILLSSGSPPCIYVYIYISTRDSMSILELYRTVDMLFSEY